MKREKLKLAAALTATVFLNVLSSGVAHGYDSNTIDTSVYTLTNIKSDADDFLTKSHDKYVLSTEKGENTASIVLNGTTYYYTPSEADNNNLQKFSGLGGFLVETTSGNELYSVTIDGTTKYYTIDTSLIPESSYTLTTASAAGENVISIPDTTSETLTDRYYNVDLKEKDYGEGPNTRTFTVNGINGGTYTINAKYDTSLPRQEISTNIDLIDGDFIDNSTTTQYGAAIHNKAAGIISNITGNFISNNQRNTSNSYGNGYAYGGAIYNKGSISNIIGNFIDNHVYTTSDYYARGGAIYNEGSISNIIGNFIGNYATASRFYSHGGAIYNEEGGTISNITGDFIGNYVAQTPKNTGGAIENAGTISNITGDFIGNSVYRTSGSSTTTGGGAIFNQRNISNITGDFIGNHASCSDSTSGGAIYNNYGTIANINGDFIGNYAYTSDSTSSTEGGAIYNFAGTIININGDFIGNYASGKRFAEGGAIYHYYRTISNITGNFIGNYASSKESSEGGAIYNRENSTISNITGNFIENYIAVTSGSSGTVTGGGAIYNQGTITNINANFTGNYASEDSYADGGAILNFTGNIENITGKYTGNHVSESLESNGGAIANIRGTININSGTTFEENKAKNGGAISNSGTTTINGGTTFKNNNAAYGGAIYNSSTLNLVTTQGDIEFSGNIASDTKGSDIYQSTDNTKTIISGTGNNKVLFNGSIAGFGTISNESNIVLNGDNSSYSGTFTQTAGTTTVNSGAKFFNKTSKIDNGTLNWNTANDLSSSASLKMAEGTSLNIGNDSDSGILTLKGSSKLTNTNINLANASSVLNIQNTQSFSNLEGSGALNNQNGNITLSGDASAYTGTYTQTGTNSALTFNNQNSIFNQDKLINAGNVDITAEESVSYQNFILGSNAKLNHNSALNADTPVINTINSSVVSFDSTASGAQANFTGAGQANSIFNLSEDISSVNQNFVNFKDATVTLGTNSYTGNTSYSLNNSLLDITKADSSIKDYTFTNLSSTGNSKIAFNVNFGADSNSIVTDTINVGSGSAQFTIDSIFIGGKETGNAGKYNTSNNVLSGNAVFSGTQQTIKGATTAYIYEIGITDNNKSIYLTPTQISGKDSLKQMNQTDGERFFQFSENDDTVYQIGSSIGQTSTGKFTVKGRSDNAQDSVISGLIENTTADKGSFYEIPQDTNVELKIENVTHQDALANTGSVLNINDTTSTASLKNTILKNNTSEQGGAINATNGTVTISDGSKFENNTATTGNGGAIYIDGGATVNIADTSFTNNSAAQGGAIYNNSKLNLNAATSDIIFTGNTASTAGSDLYQGASGITKISGNNKVVFNGSIAGSGSILSSSNVVFNGDNSAYAGSYTQTEGKTTIRNGAQFTNSSSSMEINNGILEWLTSSNTSDASTLTVNENASLVIGDGLRAAALTINGTSAINNAVVTVNNKAALNLDNDSNIKNVSGSGNITNSKNLVINGDNAGFTGGYNQTGNDSSLSIVQREGETSKFFSGNTNIQEGTLNWATTNDLSSDAILAMKNGSSLNIGYLNGAASYDGALTVNSNSDISGANVAFYTKDSSLTLEHDTALSAISANSLYGKIINNNINLDLSITDNNSQPIFSGSYTQNGANASTTVNNGTNFLAGTSTFNNGKLNWYTNNALANTAKIILNEDSALVVGDAADTTKTAALTIENASAINNATVTVNSNSTLNINNTSSVKNLAGAGKINNASNLTLNGTNNNFSGTYTQTSGKTTVNNGAQLTNSAAKLNIQDGILEWRTISNEADAAAITLANSVKLNIGNASTSDKGSLILNSNSNLNGAAVNFYNDSDMTVENATAIGTLSGDGTITNKSTGLVLNGNNSAFKGTLIQPVNSDTTAPEYKTTINAGTQFSDSEASMQINSGILEWLSTSADSDEAILTLSENAKLNIGDGVNAAALTVKGESSLNKNTSVNINNNASLTIDKNASFNGNVKGTGSLNVNNSDVSIEGDNSLFNGKFNYTNTTADNKTIDMTNGSIFFDNADVSNVTLNFNQGSAMASSSAIKANNAVFNIINNSAPYTDTIISALNNAADSANNSIILDNSSTDADFNANSITTLTTKNNVTMSGNINNSGTITNDGTLILSGDLSGSGNIINNNTLTLSGANMDLTDVTGSYTQSNGSLTVNDGVKLGNFDKNINKGSVSVNSSSAIDYSNINLASDTQFTHNALSKDVVSTITNETIKFDNTATNITANFNNGSFLLADDISSAKAAENTVKFTNSSVKLGKKSYGNDTSNTKYELNNSALNLIEEVGSPAPADKSGYLNHYEFKNFTTNNANLDFNIEINKDGTISTDTLSTDTNTKFTIGNIFLSGEENESGLLKYETTNNVLSGNAHFVTPQSISTNSSQVITAATTSFVYDIEVPSTNDQTISMTTKEFANENTLYNINANEAADRYFQFSTDKNLKDNTYHIGQSLSETAAGNFIVQGSTDNASESILSGAIGGAFITQDGKKTQELTGAHGSFFDIQDGKGTNLSIKNLTVQDAQKTGSGAVVSNNSDVSTITFDNTIIKNNSSTANGGAIYNGVMPSDTTKDNLIIQNSQFIGNAAAKGGAIYNQGNMLISNTKFLDDNNTDSVLNDIYNTGKASSSNSDYETLITNEGTYNFNQDNISGKVINDNTMSFTDSTVNATGSIENNNSLLFQGDKNTISGNITSNNNTATITNTSKDLILNGDNSGYTGNFVQNNNGETEASTTVTNMFLGGTTTINQGTLKWYTPDTIENARTDSSKLIMNEGSKLDIGSDSVIALLKVKTGDNINKGTNISINKNSTLAVSGTTIDMDANDNWSGTITLDKDDTNTILNIDNVQSNGKLDAQNGTVNLLKGNLDIKIGSAIKEKAAANLAKDTTLNISGGEVELDSNDSWGSDTTLKENGALTVKDIHNSGKLMAYDGKLTINKFTDNNAYLEIGEGSFIKGDDKNDVEAVFDGNINITNGGEVAVTNNDIWNGEIAVNGGTLNYGANNTEKDKGTLIANTGNLNILKNSVLNLNKEGTKIENEVAIDIQKASKVILGKSDFKLTNEDKWNGLISMDDENGTLTTSDFQNNSSSGGALQQTAGTSKFTDGSNIYITDKSSYITGGNIEITDKSSLTFGGNTIELNVDKMTMTNDSLFSIENGKTDKANIQDMNISGKDNVAIDINPRKWKSDTLTIKNLHSDDSEPATLNISDFNFIGLAPIDRNIKVKLFDAENIDNVVFDKTDKQIFTPIGWYELLANGGGYYTAHLSAYNPQVFRGQVATMAAYNNQLVVDDMLTNHFILHGERMIDRAKYANKYAAASPIFNPYQRTYEEGGLWSKNYAVFEKLSMTQGLSVGNNTYGTIAGADLPAVELKQGWKYIASPFVAYNGGHQHFNGVSMYQNGAQLGVLNTFLKDKFIGSIAAYGGGYLNDMNVAGYSDNTGNWFAGTAAKAAYNFKPSKHFTIQPTIFVSYNAFGKQNWHTDFGVMSMDTGMLNGINTAPGLNAIFERDTWSLYTSVQYMYNINEKISATAGNVNLPKVQMRHGYIQYGLGFTKSFKDRFNSYGQVMLRNGGRTGIGFQAGLNYLF